MYFRYSNSLSINNVRSKFKFNFIINLNFKYFVYCKSNFFFNFLDYRALLKKFFFMFKFYFFIFKDFFYRQNVLLFIFLTKHPLWGKRVKLHKNFFLNRTAYLISMQKKYRKWTYQKVGDEIFFIQCINNIFGPEIGRAHVWTPVTS